jgi:hypothetical protein
MPLLFDKDNCSVCGSVLVQREHWKLCPVCEPMFFKWLPDGFTIVPIPTLLDKGIGKDRRGGK